MWEPLGRGRWVPALALCIRPRLGLTWLGLAWLAPGPAPLPQTHPGKGRPICSSNFFGREIGFLKQEKIGRENWTRILDKFLDEFLEKLLDLFWGRHFAAPSFLTKKNGRIL